MRIQLYFQLLLIILRHFQPGAQLLNRQGVMPDPHNDNGDAAQQQQQKQGGKQQIGRTDGLCAERFRGQPYNTASCCVRLSW